MLGPPRVVEEDAVAGIEKEAVAGGELVLPLQVSDISDAVVPKHSGVRFPCVALARQQCYKFAQELDVFDFNLVLNVYQPA